MCRQYIEIITVEKIRTHKCINCLYITITITMTQAWSMLIIQETEVDWRLHLVLQLSSSTNCNITYLYRLSRENKHEKEGQHRRARLQEQDRSLGDCIWQSSTLVAVTMQQGFALCRKIVKNRHQSSTIYILRDQRYHQILET